MGPFSDIKQKYRADSIKRLLDTNPQLDDYMKSIWQMKLKDLALTEDEYNTRVKQVYSLIKPKHRGWVTYE
ncbi:MAG: hypothetical protein CMN33_01175 [Saprospirales bacterium]|nr:hypothetical protein [Saprospirales bacterium]